MDKAIQQLPSFKRMLNAANKAVKIGEDTVTSITEVKPAWAKLLACSVDCKDLTYSDTDLDCNFWLKKNRTGVSKTTSTCYPNPWWNFIY